MNSSQLVEHRTSITEVVNPTEASELFLGFLSNCFSCFITARIICTSILYLQCTHSDVHYIMYSSQYELYSNARHDIKLYCVW